MKNLNTLVGVLAIAAAPAAFAHMDHFNEPYLGVDLIQTNQRFKTGFGAAEYAKNPIDYNVFAGFKFTRHFGLEAGWEQQFKKKRTADLNNTLVVEDEPFPGSVTTKSHVKARHPYLGVFGECKLHAWKFQAMLGASFSKVKLKSTVLSLVGLVPADYAVGLIRTSSKSKVIPMVKLNVMYNFTECFGMRVTGTYRNTSKIKLNIDQDPDNVNKLKDTFGVGLGVVYTFA